MKRILVPTDFSDCANAASEVALQLAKRSGAEIYFLHLAIGRTEFAKSPKKSIAYTDEEIGLARFKLDQLVRAAEADDIKSKPELVIGTGQERIQDFIKPYKIDWLVMGSHGATGIRERIIGSKTQYTIRNLQVPSIVVKHMPIKSALDHIVFASNFKKDNTHSLGEVINFARIWGSKVHLLFINTLDHLIDDKIARLMMSVQIKNFASTNFTLNVTETNDSEFGIMQFANDIKADMIAVSMESNSLIGRLLNPSIAEQLINHSALPVLIINQR